MNTKQIAAEHVQRIRDLATSDPTLGESLTNPENYSISGPVRRVIDAGVDIQGPWSKKAVFFVVEYRGHVRVDVAQFSSREQCQALIDARCAALK